MGCSLHASVLITWAAASIAFAYIAFFRSAGPQLDQAKAQTSRSYMCALWSASCSHQAEIVLSIKHVNRRMDQYNVQYNEMCCLSAHNLHREGHCTITVHYSTTLPEEEFVQGPNFHPNMPCMFVLFPDLGNLPVAGSSAICFVQSLQ